MNEPDRYSIKFTASYERDLAQVARKHYRKVPATSLNELSDLLSQFYTTLETDPRPRGSALEPWPKKAHQPPWEFRKARFEMPGLHGASQQGRIMYLLHPTEQVVVLVFLYTHKEYPEYLDDKTLRKRLQEGMELTSEDE